MSTFVNSVNCLYCLYLLPQCGGWYCHRCWAPLSQRCQRPERSLHEKRSLECKFLQLKPCLRQKKMWLVLLYMEKDVWFKKQSKLKWTIYFFSCVIYPVSVAVKCYMCLSVHECCGTFPRLKKVTEKRGSVLSVHPSCPEWKNSTFLIWALPK